MMFPDIYLASQSPRRRELLTQMGVTFSVLSVDVDETQYEQESPKEYVVRVATAKAQAAWDGLALADKKPLLGSDTSVILGDTILGKPNNKQHASDMLAALSGRTHQVMTAVAIITATKVWTAISVSLVTFSVLSDDDRAWYISTQEGVDKAGAYAVQGLAALFIDKIEGSYSGIMGLPIRETALLLAQIAAESEEAQ